MLIGLSGYARSGKDTVGNYLVHQHGFVRFAFADALKDMAYTLNPLIPVVPENPAVKATIRLQPLVNEVGWDNAKNNPEVRRLLQVLGTECGRDIIGQNVWVDILRKKIDEYDYKGPPGEYHAVITDCRFTNEAKFIKSRGQLWWVEREPAPLNSHISENTLSHKNADVIVLNDRDLTKLYWQIDLLMEREGQLL